MSSVGNDGDQNGANFKIQLIGHRTSRTPRRVLWQWISRGLFQNSKGIISNADVNAGYNIMRKAFPEAFADGIEGAGLHPARMGFDSILTKGF